MTYHVRGLYSGPPLSAIVNSVRKQIYSSSLKVMSYNIKAIKYDMLLMLFICLIFKAFNAVSLKYATN